MDTKDKLIEKLKEYIKWLIKYIVFKTETRPLRMSSFESEIAALDKQVEEQESKEDQYRKRLNAGRDFLMTQDPKYLTIEDCLEAFGFTRDGLNEID